jgi:hypothetical protein
MTVAFIVQSIIVFALVALIVALIVVRNSRKD